MTTTLDEDRLRAADAHDLLGILGKPEAGASLVLAWDAKPPLSADDEDFCSRAAQAMFFRAYSHYEAIDQDDPLTLVDRIHAAFTLRVAAAAVTFAEIAEEREKTALRGIAEILAMTQEEIRQAKETSLEVNVGPRPTPKPQLVRRRVVRDADGLISAMVDEPLP